ncbi:hypothetical protein CQW23_19643 [Capsicum baccatum]|uniref:F-box/kelch-repeat protein n=1 Tax=Capsicum baccatum TaxID=33114 RepID=A0A2G2W6G7_CAPBA|nr:hypothetical protein CQW23_19643 [Capsicum baccatum]
MGRGRKKKSNKPNTISERARVTKAVLRNMGSPFVVYIRGYSMGDYLWYRMEFENKSTSDVDDCERERVNFKSFAQLCPIETRGAGGWAVIGEDIYWVDRLNINDEPGFDEFENDEFENEMFGIYSCLDVFKHNNCSSDWVKVSSRRIPCYLPFVGAVSGGKKLCVISGYEGYLPKPTNYQEASRSPEERLDSYDWSKAGEIYDPDSNSWTNLDTSMVPGFHECCTHIATLALDKDIIAFFDQGCDACSVLICDLGEVPQISDF